MYSKTLLTSLFIIILFTSGIFLAYAAAPAPANYVAKIDDNDSGWSVKVYKAFSSAQSTIVVDVDALVNSSGSYGLTVGVRTADESIYVYVKFWNDGTNNVFQVKDARGVSSTGTYNWVVGKWYHIKLYVNSSGTAALIYDDSGAKVEELTLTALSSPSFDWVTLQGFGSARTGEGYFDNLVVSDGSNSLIQDDFDDGDVSDWTYIEESGTGTFSAVSLGSSNGGSSSSNWVDISNAWQLTHDAGWIKYSSPALLIDPDDVHNGHPVAWRLSNGSYAVAWDVRPNLGADPSDRLEYTFLDENATQVFSQQSTLLDPTDPLGARRMAAITLSSGRVLVAYTQSNGTTQNNDDIYVMYSDDGVSFSSPIAVSTDENIQEHQADFLELDDGSILMAIKYGADQIRIFNSSDSGVTWSLLSTITVSIEPWHPQLAKYPNGTLLLEYGDHINLDKLYYRTSNDGGQTWSSEKVFLDYGSSEQRGSDLQYIGSGFFLVECIDHKLMAFYGSPGNWTGPITLSALDGEDTEMHIQFTNASEYKGFIVYRTYDSSVGESDHDPWIVYFQLYPDSSESSSNESSNDSSNNSSTALDTSVIYTILPVIIMLMAVSMVMNMLQKSFRL